MSCPLKCSVPTRPVSSTLADTGTEHAPPVGRRRACGSWRSDGTRERPIDTATHWQCALWWAVCSHLLRPVAPPRVAKADEQLVASVHGLRCKMQSSSAKPQTDCIVCDGAPPPSRRTRACFAGQRRSERCIVRCPAARGGSGAGTCKPVETDGGRGGGDWAEQGLWARTRVTSHVGPTDT